MILLFVFSLDVTDRSLESLRTLLFLHVVTIRLKIIFFFFFLKNPPPTKSSPLPLHAPLPISPRFLAQKRSDSPRPSITHPSFPFLPARHAYRASVYYADVAATISAR